MPNRDGTGPFGTWKNCDSTDEQEKPIQRRKDIGFGWRARTFNKGLEIIKEQEKQILEQEKEYLQKELEKINKKLNELRG